MKLNTTSAVVSFAKELEENSIKFYEDLVQRYPEDKEVFLSFIRENKKNVILVQRVYYEVITDAIEGCFSFEGLDTENYVSKLELTTDINYSDVLKMAMKMEKGIQRFYLDAAEVSRSLMADIPRVFERIAKGRDKCKMQLESFYNKSMAKIRD
ncbi:MAG: hypothetical protein IBV53_09690 [Candidatus Atribacteria bacterium]